MYFRFYTFSGSFFHFNFFFCVILHKIKGKKEVEEEEEKDEKKETCENACLRTKVKFLYIWHVSCNKIQQKGETNCIQMKRTGTHSIIQMVEESTLYEYNNKYTFREREGEKKRDKVVAI